MIMMSYGQRRICEWIVFSILVLIGGCSRSKAPGTEPVPAPSAVSESQESDSHSSDDDFLVRHNQAVGLMGQFKYPEAFASFSELVKREPDDNELLVNTAIARLNMAGDGDLVAAREMLQQVLNRNPDDLRANYCIGLIDTYLGPPANPTAYFQRVAAAVPDDPDAAYLYAKALEQDDNLLEAKGEYQRCLKLNPYYASAILGLARITRMRGDTVGATRLIAEFEAMKANPNGRIFEFAYRRMGRLGEVVSPTPTIPPKTLPSGSLFNKPTRLSNRDFSTSILAHNEMVEMAVADLDGNGLLDLVLVFESGLSCVLNIGHDEQVGEFPWLATTDVTAVAFADIDQNGEIDVFLARRGLNQLWLQTDGDWTQVEDANVASGEFHTTACRIFDFDHDGDLDIVCCNLEGPLQIINNNRDGTFRLLELDPTITEATKARAKGKQFLTLGDFDNRRDTDLLVSGAEGGSLVLWNERLWNYRLDQSLPAAFSDLKARGAVCCDLDRDGTMELVVRSESGFQVWKWTLQQGWSLIRNMDSSAKGLDLFAIVDLDGDGKLELIFDIGNQFQVMELPSSQASEGRILNESEHSIQATLDGDTILGWTVAPLHSQQGYSLIYLDSRGKLFTLDAGPGRHEFASIKFSGAESIAESMRSNLSGIGTRWRAQLGTNWVTGQAFPPISGSSQSLIPEVIGMQGHDKIDFIAVDWTDGVFQVELAVPAGELVTVSETQRQLASCPVVYAWNGEKIEFVTDVLGVGGIGFLIAPGEYAPSRPWEHLMLSPKQLQPKDQRLIIKVGEPMEEACYLKSAKLLSVSLPTGWNYVVDERMGTSAPEPTGEIYFYRDEYPPIEATSSIQMDVKNELSLVDGVAPNVGPLDQRFIGLLKDEFELEFSFGDVSSPKPPGQLALLIDGWVEYPYSQVVFAAWQASRTYDPPTLEVSRDGIEWKVAWQHFGFPAGMPRRMLLPLPQHITAAERFRIRTPMQIYWDRISLVALEPCPRAIVESHRLERAEVRQVGFPKRTTHNQFRPHYDYSKRQGTWDSRHLPGFYTRFGDVTELFQKSMPNSPLVIFGPGEEVHLEFSSEKTAAAQRPVGTSSSQTNVSEGLKLAGYVLKLEGWCKDMDLYTQDGNLLDPVPNSDGVSKELELRYNSRYESGPWYLYPATK